MTSAKPRRSAHLAVLAAAVTLAAPLDALAEPEPTSAPASAPAPVSPAEPGPPMSTPPAEPGPPRSSPDAAPEPEPEPDASASASASSSKSSARSKRRKPKRNAADPTPAAAPMEVKTSPGSTLTIGGYIETFYSYNFNRPSNGLTNFRAFDNQHNALTLQNAALDTAWESEQVYARLALQAGHAPNTYYGVSEPSRLGSDGVGTSDATLFRNIQQAYAGVRPFKKAPVFIEGGVFLSPIGFEGLAIHENWHWSHSPLFFALPFYHSGLKVGANLGEAHQIKVGLYNGWNNVVDNNSQKSLAAEYAYTPSDRFNLAAVYFTGAERPTGAPEGSGWRHVLNVAAKGAPVPRLGLVGNINGGVEPNAFGLSRWFATAGGLRVEALPWLFVAGRGSFIAERRGDSGGVASPILLANYTADPYQWMASGTLTFDIRPVPDHFAIKVEYRHDHARSDIFFRGTVTGDGSAMMPYVANAPKQDTLMLGLHAWF
jgi:hypothetical protein